MSSKVRPLYFLHITKTAGTSIEAAGLEHGIKWGINSEWSRLNLETIHRHHWHLSLSKWKPEHRSELLEKFESFVVVRDPVERVVSEYRCGAGNKLGTGKSKWLFNCVIFRYLLAVLLREGIAWNGHWEPQHRFIFYRGKKLISHILRFSHLEEDLNCLMKSRGIELKLPHRKKGVDYAFGSKDIYAVNHILIRLVYFFDYLFLRKFWVK